jgi:uncharacterized protein (DUF1800 family)
MVMVDEATLSKETTTQAKPVFPVVNDQSHPVITGLVVSALSLALTACGGGGGGAGSSTGSNTSASITSAQTSINPSVSSTPPTETQAARFLQQAQFSASESDVTAVKSQGYVAWLNAQMNANPAQTGWEWLLTKGQNFASATQTNEVFYRTGYVHRMIWNQLIASEDQVRKRLAFALSEMMVVSAINIDGIWPQYKIAAYWDILANNVFGNFRTLIEEISLNPFMGEFLNTRFNQKEDAASGRQPDENYAREVMQLFTIGLYELNNDGSFKTNSSGQKIETYDTNDVSNLARVFTGYDFDFSTTAKFSVSWIIGAMDNYDFARLRMSNKASRHSLLEKKFLNVTIPANTDAATSLRIALDTLFNHPNVGPFFARQMIQRLVTSNPSPAYIDRVAKAFNNNGSGVRGDLKAVWRAILTDSEALNLPSSNSAGKIREPIIRLVQMLRTLGHKTTNGQYELDILSSEATGLAQSPFMSPSVFNYFRPGYVPPNTDIASANQVAPEFQIISETTIAGYLNFIMGFIKNGLRDVSLDLTAHLKKAEDATTLINWLNLYLTANQLSVVTISTIKTALESVPVTASSSDTIKSDRIRLAVFLIMASPQYLVQK